MGARFSTLETMVRTGTVDVWDELAVSRQLELRAYVRAKDTMTAWEQEQLER